MVFSVARGFGFSTAFLFAFFQLSCVDEKVSVEGETSTSAGLTSQDENQIPDQPAPPPQAPGSESEVKPYPSTCFEVPQLALDFLMKMHHAILTKVGSSPSTSGSYHRVFNLTVNENFPVINGDDIKIIAKLRELKRCGLDAPEFYIFLSRIISGLAFASGKNLSNLPSGLEVFDMNADQGITQIDITMVTNLLLNLRPLQDANQNGEKDFLQRLINAIRSVGTCPIGERCYDRTFDVTPFVYQELDYRKDPPLNILTGEPISPKERQINSSDVGITRGLYETGKLSVPTDFYMFLGNLLTGVYLKLETPIAELPPAMTVFNRDGDNLLSRADLEFVTKSLLLWAGLSNPQPNTVFFDFENSLANVGCNERKNVQGQAIIQKGNYKITIKGPNDNSELINYGGCENSLGSFKSDYFSFSAAAPGTTIYFPFPSSVVNFLLGVDENTCKAIQCLGQVVRFTITGQYGEATTVILKLDSQNVPGHVAVQFKPTMLPKPSEYLTIKVVFENGGSGHFAMDDLIFKN